MKLESIHALFVGLFLIVGVGCGTSRVTHQETSLTGQGLVTLQEKLLPRSNPTSYEFNAVVEDVKPAIQRAFGERLWKKMEGEDPPFGAALFWKESRTDALSEDVFAKPGNEDDAFLFGGGVYGFGKSQVYFKNGLPLPYFADFHIHLTRIGASKTRVEIFTHHPWVSAGLDPSAPLGPAYIVVD